MFISLGLRSPEQVEGRFAGRAKEKALFFHLFSLLMFGYLLKYLYVCRQANINRQ
jgi:hypothetical protein